ncbi:copper chaperone PCu(A)C [Marinobacterium sp. MBR-109]|jgi:copper(I)-binding protein|uniref:copper chaperone PCu(A)C n=1 Tax=Marinobacterium sp. MBR-109 TaxID=3156462 RepID=UPI0033909BE9
MTRLSILLTTLCLSISMACAAEISVEQPFARATPPGQPNSAAFMQLVNKGETTALVAAKSSVADVVELHTHTNDEGVMRMRRIEQIELPAGDTTVLQPGGLHVMLIGLKQPLQEGSQIDLSLEFADGSQQQIDLPVQMAMPAGMQMQQHTHGGH